MTTQTSISRYAEVPGPLADLGYSCVAWTDADAADAFCHELMSRTGAATITRNCHVYAPGVETAVRTSALVEAVIRALGPVVAVENTFLVVKAPAGDFTVPAHQDGINDRLVLDPERSVAAWLAITPATVANGCLELAPGSHRGGYLPYGRSSAPGTPLATLGPGPGTFTPIELGAGEACLMDVRLLHRSGANRTNAARVGLNVRYVAPGAIHHRSGTQPQMFPVAGDWPATTD